MFNMLGWPSKKNDLSPDSGRGSPPPQIVNSLPKFRNPVIGIAFGAGAARGWAHIGVLNALIEAGIKPSVVAGTSIGAVVGGCWAAGRLDQLTDFAKGLTKRRILGLMDIHLGGSGLITGSRLRHMLEAGIGDTQIEDLPVKFAAVTTEFQTGHEIWLTRGHLVTAMRASYAIPGIFEPMNIAGRWLFDGALVNPVPVSVARALGAEMVISVSLNADHNGRGTVIQDHFVEALPIKIEEGNPKPNSIFSPVTNVAGMFGRLTRRNHGAPGMARVMVDAINITQDRIARSRLAGDPPDVALVPKLSKIGLFEFQRAEESIELGREAVARSLPEIKESIQSLIVAV
jgi:NTE family protein